VSFLVCDDGIVLGFILVDPGGIAAACVPVWASSTVLVFFSVGVLVPSPDVTPLE